MKRSWILTAGLAAALGVKCILDWNNTQKILARVAWLHARLDRSDELWEMFLEEEGVPS